MIWSYLFFLRYFFAPSQLLSLLRINWNTLILFVPKLFLLVSFSAAALRSRP